MDWYWPDDADVRDGLPGYKPTTKGHPRKIREAAELILRSERPVIYAGGGILKAARGRGAPRAGRAVRHPRRHHADGPRAPSPTPTTCASACPGMHGNYTAVTSMQRSDLLIALGSRFDDRVTGKIPAFAPDAKIIHVDIDPAELGKVRRPDVPIVGDCRLVIEELVAVIKDLLAGGVGLPRPLVVEADDLGLAGELPARLQAVGAGRRPQAPVRARAAPRQHARRLHRRLRRRASTRCGPRSTGSSTTPTRG